jgi:hypothetical protein
MSKAKETLSFLANFNSWRRGDLSMQQPDPIKVGEVIDDAVDLLMKYDELECDKERFSTKYRIKFHHLEDFPRWDYFALQKRRWFGWKTLCVAELERVINIRNTLINLDTDQK